ncbi:MAG: hypothetical protein AAGM22_08110 [Acidobacteriota bacterium]
MRAFAMLAALAAPWISSSSAYGQTPAPPEPESARSAAAPVTQDEPPAEGEASRQRLQDLMAEFLEIERAAFRLGTWPKAKVYFDFFDEHGGKHPLFDRYLTSRVAEQWCTLGNYRGALQAFDQSHNRRSQDAEKPDAQRASLDGYEAQDAVDVIVKASQGRRAVLINEAHHVPQHRALTRRLLPALRGQGFTHFAAETLSPPPILKRSTEKGYPTGETGYYTEEPLYADLVRAAMALGFEIVAYESTDLDRDTDRELSQAQNLKARVFDGAEDARVLVHLGFSHNREAAEVFSGEPAMAYRLRELTGIDPLTVDQVSLSERSVPELEHPLYGELCGGLDGPNPVALSTSGGATWALPDSGRDVTVCSPRSRYQEGRPTWLALDGLRRFVPLEPGLCGDAAECLVEARPADEGEDAIPIDRVLVQTGEPLPALALPAGTFKVSISSEGGALIRQATLVVKP